MKKDPPAPIFKVSASLWDGNRQLAGTLELWETEVLFRFSDFNNSHLNLTIPLPTIEKVEEYLVYDLTRNGLLIQNKNGKFDLFVLEEVRMFKKALQEQIDRLK